MAACPQRTHSGRPRHAVGIEAQPRYPRRLSATRRGPRKRRRITSPSPPPHLSCLLTRTLRLKRPPPTAFRWPSPCSTPPRCPAWACAASAPGRSRKTHPTRSSRKPRWPDCGIRLAPGGPAPRPHSGQAPAWAIDNTSRGCRPGKATLWVAFCFPGCRAAGQTRTSPLPRAVDPAGTRLIFSRRTTEHTPSTPQRICSSQAPRVICFQVIAPGPPPSS